VSRYQKGKTNLDFTVARDSEWQWHQLGHMQVCTSLQTDNQADTPPLSFLQAGCLSCRPTNSVKALKAKALSHTGRQLQCQLDIRMTANALSSSLFHHKAHTVITGLGCYHQLPVAECLFMSTDWAGLLPSATSGRMFIHEHRLGWAATISNQWQNVYS